MGRKRISPIAKEAREEVSTAAAATSFAIFASPLISGLTKSTIASREVLTSSKIRTKVIIKTSPIHSNVESLRTNPIIEAIAPRSN